MNTPPHEPLIRRVLGANFFELTLHRLTIEELDGGSRVKVEVLEGDQTIEVEGSGVGLVDALFVGLLDRYAREYQSLKTIQMTGFQVAADIETKKAQPASMPWPASRSTSATAKAGNSRSAMPHAR